MKDLKFVGIGGAYALELGGNCAYLKDGKDLLIIDCCEDATLKLNNVKAFDGVENITIAITHTHADHVAGLGTFLWYANFLLNIKPKIISNSKTFENHTRQLLNLLGVAEKFYEFIPPNEFTINDCSLEMKPTNHTSILECFGIMFTDKLGKYYYSGDTKDIDYIRNLANDSNVKKIYCEVCNACYDAHIDYEQLKSFINDKFVLMHFEDVALYNKAINAGYNVAKRI